MERTIRRPSHPTGEQILAGLATLMLMLSIACAGPSPEQRLRNLLAEAERAAEAGEVATLVDMIAEDYADGEGRDRATLAGLVTLHFEAHPAAHVLQRIRSLRVEAPGRGQVSLVLALAARPIEARGDRVGYDAEVVRLDLEFREDEKGAWRVTRAVWEPAMATELL